MSLGTEDAFFVAVQKISHFRSEEGEKVEKDFISWCFWLQNRSQMPSTRKEIQDLASSVWIGSGMTRVEEFKDFLGSTRGNCNLVREEHHVLVTISWEATRLQNLSPLHFRKAQTKIGRPRKSLAIAIVAAAASIVTEPSVFTFLSEGSTKSQIHP